MKSIVDGGTPFDLYPIQQPAQAWDLADTTGPRFELATDVSPELDMAELGHH